MNLIRKAALCLSAAVLVTIPLAHAQETSGTISGTVIDSSGAPVPGATVSITASDRNIQVRSTKPMAAAFTARPCCP
jgi:hypothetical protein